MENDIVPYRQDKAAKAELLDEGELMTPGYLQEKGFVSWTESDYLHDFDYPFNPDQGELLYVQKELDRNMFVVILQPKMFAGQTEPDGNHYRFDILIRHNVGCGFVRIPNKFSHMPVKYFEMLYEAIRREKL
jgi:hypothetical protein